MLDPAGLPGWPAALAWAWIGLAALSAAAIGAHILACQPPLMPVMRWVWPINALWMGPFAVWAYWRIGRYGMQAKDRQPYWQAVLKATAHCGAGCTLGDMVAEWLVFLLGLSIAGRAFWPEVAADYLLAYACGIVFQFFSIAPMRHLGISDGLVAAVRADTLSLTAFEVACSAGWR